MVAFLAISIVFLLISAVYAVFSVVLAPNLPAYLIVLGISCLLLPITLYVGRRSRVGLQICLSLFLSSLYSLGIYLSTVTSPGGPATAFIAFLLTLPTLFILPPLENMCSVVIWDMLFFLFVSASKDARIIQIDMLNGIIYGCISIIASTYVMHMMMQNFITRARLRYVAENDQTTGLRNRNAYEREQNDIPGRCRRTLSCVYMDINGLHELNNAMGHQAGDIMLREVADELKKQFGDELTYRMGGDEYVAFAPTCPRTGCTKRCAPSPSPSNRRIITPLSAGQPARLRRCAWKICSALRRAVCTRPRALTTAIKRLRRAAADFW